MHKKRHGLIIESMETAKIGGTSNIPSATVDEYPACKVTTVKVETDDEAAALDREKGSYITVEYDKTYNINDNDFESVVSVITKILRGFTDRHQGERIVIAGIGSRRITADSIGPKTIDRIIVTRGLENTEFIGDGCFGNVCAVCTDVFGVTGIESAELIEGIARVLEPALIVVIDALATTKLSRLCKTVQISDTSLVPGGGVGNTRERISSDRMEIPMVSVGVPTVIDTALIAGESGALGEYGDELISMPARIDDATDLGAKLIAFALNKALHYGMSTEDILRFLY